MADISRIGIKTIENQNTYANQLNLTVSKLNFKTVLAISKETALKLNTHCIYPDYMYYIKRDKCAVVTFTQESARRFMYKPKLLAHTLYKNVEFYALILRLNYMKSISDFTMERLIEGIVLPYVSISDFFDEVLIKEKLPINRNLAKVNADVKLTQQ